MTTATSKEWRHVLLSGIVGALLGAGISATVTLISMRVQSESRKKESDRARGLDVIDRYVRACNQTIMINTRLEALLVSEQGSPMSPQGKQKLADMEREVYANIMEYKIQAQIANLTFGQEVAMPLAMTNRFSGPDEWDVQTKGSIGGTVADQNVNAIDGAMVTITGPEESRTDPTINGVFSFDNLSPATYSVKVTSTGFKTASVSNVGVFVGQQSVLHIKLEPGEVTAVVKVTGDSSSYKNALESRSVLRQATEKQCDNTANRMFGLLPK